MYLIKFLVLFLIVFNFANSATTTADTSSSAFKSLYDEVIINDPQPQSSGIYFRMSQKGVNYLTSLASEALPLILNGMILPKVEVTSFKGENFIITKMDKPNISAIFIDQTGINATLHIPYLEIEGESTIDALVTAESHMSVIVRNWTIHLDVSIKRDLGDDRNNITVTRCHGHVPVVLNFTGSEDSDFLNSLSDMIGDTFETTIKDKLCELPEMLNAFFEMHQQKILEKTQKSGTDAPIASSTSVPSQANSDIGFCSDYFGGSAETKNEAENEDDEIEDALDGLGDQLKSIGTWTPDLSLKYPLTFSNKDVVFGIDGGAVLNGEKADVERSKISNVTLIRDQMLGLIVNEYILNSILFHVHENSLGYFEDTYTVRRLPKNLRPVARFACGGCKIILQANITEHPHVTIHQNGIVMVLEGSIGAHFHRLNKSNELLVADGVFRIILKPEFRHSRVFSNIQLTGVDFKIYKVALTGMFSTTAQKLLNFIIPKTIWPKIQKSLRFAINRRGFQLPTICGVHFEKLHVGYVPHAAIITSDFTFNLPHFLKAFQQFMRTN